MNHWTSRGTQVFSSRSRFFSRRRISRCWSSASRIWKPSGRPASCACRRSSRCARPWKVPIHRWFTGMSSSSWTRPRISAAALLVNVTARMPSGETFSTWISQAIRCTSTRVLPLPAPATTSMGSWGAVTASRWASFSGSRIGVTSMAAEESSSLVLLADPELDGLVAAADCGARGAALEGARWRDRRRRVAARQAVVEVLLGHEDRRQRRRCPAPRWPRSGQPGSPGTWPQTMASDGLVRAALQAPRASARLAGVATIGPCSRMAASVQATASWRRSRSGSPPRSASSRRR